MSTRTTPFNDQVARSQPESAPSQLTLSVTDPATPIPGDGYWYLIRTRDAVGTATYDNGSSSQVGLRDAEVQASGNDCM